YSESADLVEFLAYSGMRIEEARRLEWKDIGKESISVPDIKHATERRTLYINPSLQDVIGGIRAHHKQPNGANKVFVVQSPRKALTNACIRLGIAHVRVHDLRHFFATSCIESGIDIPTVSRCSPHIGMDEKRRIAGSYLRAT
ncbi:MAG: tyrosine-type recombinase/integrase, partial [Kiritimatiellia bacterium]